MIPAPPLRSLLLLLSLPSIIAAADDWRSISTGQPIPKEGYCDQPYVVINPDGSWLCTMTTGAGKEGDRGQHIVATTSRDQGKTWSALVSIEPAGGPEASWVSPLIIPGGRVFAFYTYNDQDLRTVNDDAGNPIKRVDTLGKFVFKISDDAGATWSASRYEVPIRTTEIDRKNVYGGRIHFFWSICKPIVVGKSVFVTIHKVGNFNNKKGFMVTSEGFVFRSDDLLSQPDPAKITWTMLPAGDVGLRSPEGPVADEQNLVSLSDGSLFCMYRTVDGHPCQAYSRDAGATWTAPAHATYWPGGPKFRHPRACPKVWKTSEGKFLFWFHNNGNRTYNRIPGQPTGSRNVAWLSGGIERKDGFIHWSQPEVVLYDEDWTVGPSYPDLIEQDGAFWTTETQKTIARVHPIDRTLLEGLWSQSDYAALAEPGLVLNLVGEFAAAREVAMPALAPLPQHGFSIDLQLRCNDHSADQTLLDWRNADGKGGRLSTTPSHAVQLELNDGKTKATWECDPGLLKPAQSHHLTVTVDGGPRIISFLIDGRLCDGGDDPKRPYGWGRFDKTLADVNGGPLRLAPSLKGQLQIVRLYDRPLRTSEAVGNARHDLP
jgi:hypothetical protein